MAERTDPFRQPWFLLEIDGLAVAGFSRCDLPASRSAVVEYREGADPSTPRKLSGLTEYGPLVLETGVTDRSYELFEWRTLVERGAMVEARRSVRLTLLDASRAPVAAWHFREAWPARYEAPRLSATANEVAIERLVVVHEGFGRIDLGTDEEETADEPVNLPSADLASGSWTPRLLDPVTDDVPWTSDVEPS